MKRIASALLLLLTAPACGGDDSADPDSGVRDASNRDALTDDDADPPGDGAPIDAAPTSEFLRGKYLVDQVVRCGDCHTPRTPSGYPDETRYLGGNPTFLDADPEDDESGNLPAPNLTPHATGLGDWTLDEIKTAFLDGTSRDGDALSPVMPYYILHNMSPSDADAIAVYLASLAPVDQELPGPQPPFSQVETPAEPFPIESIPDSRLPPGAPDYEDAQRGRYLAAFVGLCIECHTPRTDPLDPSSLDPALLFAGDQPFVIPPFGSVVYAGNITPDDETGIGTWSVADIQGALLNGQHVKGGQICPPMPIFEGMSADDARAIALFLTTMAPIRHEITEQCKPIEL